MKHWGNRTEEVYPWAKILIEGEGPQGYDLSVYAVAEDGTRLHLEGVTKAEWSVEASGKPHLLTLNIYNTAFTIRPDP